MNDSKPVGMIKNWRGGGGGWGRVGSVVLRAQWKSTFYIVSC